MDTRILNLQHMVTQGFKMAEILAVTIEEDDEDGEDGSHNH